MPATKIDLLVNCRWIIPIVPENQVLENCALAVDTGRILGLFPQAEAAKRFSARETLQLDKHVLMPGLINAHSHAAMSLLRGFADDLPLKSSLEDSVYPTESHWLNEEFVSRGSQLAMAEMIKRGTTCFADTCLFHETLAEQVRHAGLRCQIGFAVTAFPTVHTKDADQAIHQGLALYDRYSGHSSIKVACAPQALDSLSDELLRQLATFANELDMAMQMPCHANAGEIIESEKNYGCRPLLRLQELGLLLPQTQLLHMTQLNAEDTRRIQENNCHVVHCPESNLKLASGFCPVGALINAGVNVALGTGGGAGNHHLDLFAELKTAALLAKAVAGDTSTLDGHAALRMATLSGAKALGWHSEIGSLEAGKYADVIAVKTDSIAQHPRYNPVSQLLYSQSGSRVSHSWVAGKPLLKDGKLLTLNENRLIQSAQKWHSEILH